MNWVDIVVIILLIISFLGGLKEGAVKNLSSLVALIIAIPLASLSYKLLASLLSFIPGENWQNFLGFFIAMGIISIILHLILWIPRKVVGAIWKEGVLFRLLGGIFNLVGAVIGMVVFVLLVQAFPIFDALENWVSGSDVLTTLVNFFSFIKVLLPEALKDAAISL